MVLNGVFYHGTSDVFDIKQWILPASQTNNLREEWRKKNIDKVYFTDSLLSAQMYAKKACRKYGGNPIVYVVRPIGQWFHRIDTEYIADKALVLEVYMFVARNHDGNEICARCGKNEKLTIDHFIPKSSKMTINENGSYVKICKGCNQEKSNQIALY